MQIYDQLWNQAMAAFELNQPQIDRHLLDQNQDQRRGVSLVFRPPAAVQASIKTFLDRLAVDFPGQYFYQPEEFHVTVLTLISASEAWPQEMGELARFQAILSEVLGRFPAFPIAFRGVTASPTAVMIQGFPGNDTLENIRAELRRSFAQHGFPHQLDRRYQATAAHITVMRFGQPAADWKQLAAVLQANRQASFGSFQVETLQLVWGDWYASARNTRIFEEYRLKKMPPPVS